MKRIIKLIIINIVVTAILVYMAYCQRGYFAIGGEWLVMPIIMFLRYCLKYDEEN